MKLWRLELSLYALRLVADRRQGQSFPVKALLVAWCLLRHTVARAKISRATRIPGYRLRRLPPDMHYVGQLLRPMMCC